MGELWLFVPAAATQICEGERRILGKLSTTNIRQIGGNIIVDVVVIIVYFIVVQHLWLVNNVQ
jgi:hypothetical protein